MQTKKTNQRTFIPKPVLLSFEEQLGEDVEILSPVEPYVAASVYIVGVLQTGLGKNCVQLVAALEEEVLTSATYPVKLHTGLLESLSLLNGHIAGC